MKAFRKSTISELFIDLDELLGAANEIWWRGKLKPAQGMSGDRQAKHILGWYGGMGSFNDLLLCEINGHSVSKEDYDAVNDKLDTLRSRLFDACTLIRRVNR